jgi:hypothetical protein
MFKYLVTATRIEMFAIKTFRPVNEYCYLSTMKPRDALFM